MADIRCIAFTEKGLALAKRIAAGLADEGDAVSCAKGFGEGKVDHHAWTADGFAEADALVFVGATGIAVRSIAPHVVAKDTDPAVIVIDEAGRFCIPLLSGHIGGANALAERICDITGAAFAVTTASDINGVFAVDTWATGQGLKILDTAAIKGVTSRLLKGETVTFASEFPIAGSAPEGLEPAPDDQAADIVIGIHPNGQALDLTPRIAVVGIGCRKGTEQERIEAAFAAFLAENGIAREAVCGIASIDLKKDEAGLVAFARESGFDFMTYSEDELNALEGTFSSSDFVQGVTGVDCVCERASVAAGGELVIGKTVVDGITFALSLKPCELSWGDAESAESTADMEDAVAPKRGSIHIVGLGPGDRQFMTEAAIDALKHADIICGYHVYTALASAVVPETPVFTTPMRKEIDRCRETLRLASEGKNVAMVCSGDSGVYGMAGLIMELAHEFDPVDIDVISGVTAALSGAAALGSPLTNDFCTISLSDQLTPWEDIEKRLHAAASADFCIALYNPMSHNRPHHLRNACDILLEHCAPETVCGIVRQIGREDQSSWIGTLAELRDYECDMFSTVFIGNSKTRVIDGRMVTARGYEKKSEMRAAE